MAFRPNWYDDSGGSRGFWLSSPRTWSGMRWILTLTIGVWILQLLEGAVLHTAYLTEWGALRAWFPPTARDYVAGKLHGGFNPFFPIQLVTYAVLHASLLHIGMNLLFLFFFGPELEASFGRIAFLRLYVGGAVAGGLLQWAWSLSQGEPGMVIGASGAVFAVMVLYALRWPNRTIYIYLVLPVPIWAFVAFQVLGNVMGFLGGTGGMTAVLAHIGGAAFGLLWHRSGDVVERAALRRQRDKAVRKAAETNDDRREMDRILAKIQSNGLTSLDARERGFLERRSRELREQGR